MDNNNLSDAISRFSEILKEKNIDLNSLNDQSNNTENIKSRVVNQNTTNSSENSNNINIDINTILKFKKIADKLNNSNNERTKLLLALKPFLDKNKQNKLDEYIKIVNILNVLEALNGEL